MKKITFRDIQLDFDGRYCTLSCDAAPELSAVLDADQLPELMAFLEEVCPEICDVPQEPSGESTKDSDPAQSKESGDQDDAESEPSVNRREAFRVPVVPDCGFQVTLSDGSDSVNARPMNVSMTGMLVQLDDVPKFLWVDNDVKAKLALNELRVELDAVVRRLDSDGLGLFFPASVKSEHVDPPPRLRRIVMELQRRWMTHKKDESGV